MVAAAAVAVLALPVAVQAQLSGSATIDSDYRFRGVSLSDSKPSVRLDANLDTAAGWYVGAAATQAQVAGSDRYAQLLGYGGYAMRIGGGNSLEFGASFSHFLSKNAYDFAEGYAGLLSDRWSLRLSYSPDYFGRHVKTAYLDASGHWPLGEQTRLFGHIGVLTPLAGGYPGDTDANKSRADILLGAGLALGDTDLRLGWTMASPGGPFPAPDPHRSRGSWLFSASYSF
jgi:uncharacterized protein (TIGR02001 family)